MPTPERVGDLIRYVTGLRLVEALEEFYHPDSTMQENMAAPRIGRAVSIARQKRNAALAADVLELRAASCLIDGDRVAIEWHAEWRMPDGTQQRIEEVALQVWKGDRIIRERFFYDPRPLGAWIAFA